MIVALIGRTNVGKSTLFNRLIDQKKAIVSPVAGTTRQPLKAECSWQGVSFLLIDSGGLDLARRDEIEESVVKQAELAVEHADLILMVVDYKNGLLPQDKTLALKLKKSPYGGSPAGGQKKPVILVVNKVDSPKARQDTAEFFKLGFANAFPVSAVTGMGTGDLLEEIVQQIKLLAIRSAPLAISSAPLAPRVAIAGKPNVGKSSILNALLGREEVIVTEIPGTTRDVYDTAFEKNGQKFILIDTAGIKRKGLKRHSRAPKHKVDFIEQEAVRRSTEAIKRANVVLLALDAEADITSQDKRLAQEIIRAQKNCLILLNKIDLVKKANLKSLSESIKGRLGHIGWAPMLLISALKKEGIEEILPLTSFILKESQKEIPATELRQLVNNVLGRLPRPKNREAAKKLRITSFQQISTSPQRFIIFTRPKTVLPKAIPDMIEKELRRRYGFVGVPIVITIKPSANSWYNKNLKI